MSKKETTPEAPRKDRTGCLIKIIIVLLVALLLALLGLHFYMQRAVNDLVPERPEDEEYLQGRINVLVVGTDAEEYDSGRADSIIVFNLDLDNKRVHALSIPRDSRVDIPGYKNKTKINHSYAYGGIELTKQTVENLLHVPIDYYAVTNFAGFEDIVETVGGVYIDVPIRMRTHTWYGDIDLQPGFQHLDGKSALAYVRWRGTATADIGRIERQQKFLSTALDQLMTTGTILRLPQLIGTINTYVQTDFSLKELTLLINAFKDMSSVTFNSAMVPGSDDTINGLSYWIPFANQTADLVRQMQTFTYNLPEPEPEETTNPAGDQTAGQTTAQ